MLLDFFLLGAAAGLAVIAFLLKKQAGLLILALFAGAAWSVAMTAPVVDWLVTSGQVAISLSPEALTGVALTILPVILIWFAVPKNHTSWGRVAGSVVFGLMAVVVLHDFAPSIFDEGLVADSKVYAFAADYVSWLVTLGLFYAIADMYMARLGGGERAGRHHR